MSPDIVDLLRTLTEASAHFLVVGAYAVGIHGHPRAAKDFDLWVDASDQNAPRVLRARQAFGAPLMGLTEDELRRPGVGLPIGGRRPSSAQAGTNLPTAVVTQESTRCSRIMSA